MKDAVATMGGLLPDDVGGRDAVHVAVFAATANEVLKPNQDVALLEQGVGDAVVGSPDKFVKDTIGKVDPFLKEDVPMGKRFWVYLYPRSITGLSHRWEHPSFESTSSVYATPNAKIKAENYVKDYLKKEDPNWYSDEDYENLVANFKSAFQNGYEYVLVSFQLQGHVPAELIEQMEILTGIKAKVKPSYFSCSC